MENKTSIVLSNDEFILVEAEKLSLRDEFMKHKPTTESEKITRALIIKAIDKGVKNFYKSTVDPSFNSDCANICFEKGKLPAIDESYNWWEERAAEFKPERNSRLGTRLEYGAFLGVLIKKIIENGKTAEWAWNAVCNDSAELGHYCNSKDAKKFFEPTGSREVFGFYDLANTCKILAENDDDIPGGFWLAAGACCYVGAYNPLAHLRHCAGRNMNVLFSVGWLVLEK